MEGDAGTAVANTEIRKRNIAYKLRIGDVLRGVPMMDEGKFLFLELGSQLDSTPLDKNQTGQVHQTGQGKKVVRINILANCVDKYIQEGEKQFGSLTVDDASGQLKLKVFGEDVEMFKEIMQGDTLQIIGNMREWNGELYIIPEVAKKVDARWLLVRKLEIQNSRKDIPVDESSALKNSIMQKIKDAETDGGIDIDKIIMDIEASPDLINGDIKKLLEEGLVYEPRPGRLRYLG